MDRPQKKDAGTVSGVFFLNSLGFLSSLGNLNPVFTGFPNSERPQNDRTHKRHGCERE
jgi:hypothetical protein